MISNKEKNKFFIYLLNSGFVLFIICLYLFGFGLFSRPKILLAIILLALLFGIGGLVDTMIKERYSPKLYRIINIVLIIIFASYIFLDFLKSYGIIDNIFAR